MGRSFYLKLAMTNLKKNRNAYIPYILGGMGMVFTYVLFLLISDGKGIANVVGGETLQMLFAMGTFIISVFSVIFIFYANGFLMKRRKKEIALYGILGLERKHVGIVMFYESFLSALASIGGGMILGVVFGKLFFLFLMKITKIAEGSTFVINSSVFVKTFVFFIIVYFITLLWNQLQIRLSKPIELLKGEEVGQKEKRSTPFLAIIGLVCLGAGYYLALRVVNPLAALNDFFIAVLLVIAGTYYLFRAGSIFFLKILKKNKRYYYQTNHFITVSGMIHRMKQNATGLSNICILSTMVLVTLSTTIALYVGQENVVSSRNPTDYALKINKDKVDSKELKNEIENICKKNHIEISDYQDVLYQDTLIDYTNHSIMPLNRNEIFANAFRYYDLLIMTQEQYNSLLNESIALNDDEVLIRFGTGAYKYESVKIGEKTYQVVQGSKKIPVNFGADIGATDAIFLVMDTEERIIQTINELNGKQQRQEVVNMDYQVFFNASGKYEDRIKCANEMKKTTYNMDSNRRYTNIDLDREEGYKLFGGLVFLGFFLGITFLLAMVMIIYFKQISEGFEDRKRFDILNKVGLDKKDVKKTINKQIIQVFFLPLVGAILHVSVAFKMITKLLRIFELTNTMLVFQCTLVTIGLFALIYIFVFRMTAKAYYRIVKR
ncbi:FtsX-like permease family protein [Anaerosporobacter faecicola]|uniref:FtsX-like permease family protein n=1 Tax=Anaerosporobacter faecicola TaxID=2718714 RepID=UPI00143B582B|nr:ABC transporter permease [Anaerosporobacter faecicola]